MNKNLQQISTTRSLIKSGLTLLDAGATNQAMKEALKAKQEFDLLEDPLEQLALEPELEVIYESTKATYIKYKSPSDVRESLSWLSDDSFPLRRNNNGDISIEEIN